MSVVEELEKQLAEAQKEIVRLRGLLKVAEGLAQASADRVLGVEIGPQLQSLDVHDLFAAQRILEKGSEEL
jgi:hypothetical protein